MNDARAHAESAIRQLRKLGMKSSHIDPDEIEAIESLKAVAKAGTGHKDGYRGNQSQNLIAIERALRETRQHTFTNGNRIKPNDARRIRQNK